VSLFKKRLETAAAHLGRQAQLASMLGERS
jgi:hypothetical protein